MKINFIICPNGNYKADVPLTKTEGILVIKLLSANKYKLKPWELVRGEKVFIKHLLPELGEFPIVSKEEVKETIALIKDKTTDEEDY